MRKLRVFNQVSLDGYFTDRSGDMSWAHKQDDEWRAYAAGNAGGGGVLVFGRVTYQMMAAYWPTPMAAKNDPAVAEGMNQLEKLVFSRTLETVTWKNTRLLKGDPAKELQRLKQEPGKDMVIMGSGTIVAPAARAGLIDEYTLAVNPLVLGGGRTLFEGVEAPINLKLTGTRAFKNGNVVLTYQAA